MNWKNLRPDPVMVAALSRAGDSPTPIATQTEKKLWSKSFANSCALMLADELRRSRVLKALHVLPNADGANTEFVTAAGTRGKGKKVDVSVSSLSAGLQLALTLKGGNFPDPGDAGYGKNLTGRLYELLDETRAVHEYHPHTPITCVYYFPLFAATDRPKRSTFARAVGTLRAHTGRQDPLLTTQFARFDWAVIGLYSRGLEDGAERGAVRYFDVHEAPPKVGRPTVSTTMSTTELVRRIVSLYRGGRIEQIEYVDPEPD
jgi:hypothetical protein